MRRRPDLETKSTTARPMPIPKRRTQRDKIQVEHYDLKSNEFQDIRSCLTTTFTQVFREQPNPHVTQIIKLHKLRSVRPFCISLNVAGSKARRSSVSPYRYRLRQGILSSSCRGVMSKIDKTRSVTKTCSRSS